MSTIKIIAATLSSISIICGLPFLILIIAYLKQKPTIQSSVFDLIIIDNLISSELFCLTFWATLILLPFAPTSYLIASIISIMVYIFVNLFAISCTVTVAMKLIFIKKSSLIFDQSDFKIRMITFGLKIICFFFGLFLDQIGPFQTNILAFDLLHPGHKR